MAAVFEAAGFEVAAPPWPRLPYDDAIARFGIDRPDTRFGMEIADLGGALAGTEFKVFAGALSSGGVVRGINAGKREVARSELDGLTELAQKLGAKGLVWAFVEEDGGWRSPVAKFLSDDERAAIGARARRASPATCCSPSPTRRGRPRRCWASCASSWPSASPWSTRAATTSTGWSTSRCSTGTRARSAGTRCTIRSPRPMGDLDDPGSLRSRGYDLVLDGFELGGGSIRTHRLDVQEKVFELIGLSREEASERFGFLLDALRYGAPPHGGIALGLDRIVSIVAGWRTLREVNIRESITFPKTATGADPSPERPRQWTSRS